MKQACKVDEEQAVASVRNAEGGTKMSLGCSSTGGLADRGREEERDPKGGARRHATVREHGTDDRADVDTTNSEGEPSPQEDEPAVSDTEDGVRYCSKDRHGPPEMVRHRRERRNPTAPIRQYKQYSTGQRTPREAATTAATRSWLGIDES